MLSDLLAICQLIERNWEWIALIAAVCLVAVISMSGTATAHLIHIHRELRKERLKEKENI